MKRPDQHVIDSQADALFRAVFADWSITPSERDYGWDYVVEVFRNGGSTGLLFNVQLKGSRHTAYSADRAFTSQKLEMDSAEYLARQLLLPTFLVHVDVEAKRIFWSTIQLDQKVLDGIRAGNASSLTVRIPTANQLPDRRDQFAKDLGQALIVVAARTLGRTSLLDFASAMAAHPAQRQHEIATDLHERAFLLELDAAHRQGQAGDATGAIAALDKIAMSAKAAGYVPVEFHAVWRRGLWEWMQLIKSEIPQARAAQQKLETARELCRIAKRTPRYLHLAAQILRRTAELGIATDTTFGVLMSWYAHRKRREDPLWIAVLTFQLQQHLLDIHRGYQRVLRLARATAKSQYRWVTVRPITELGTVIGTLAGLLKKCGLPEAGAAYRQAAFALFKFAAAVAEENQSIDELHKVVMDARILDMHDPAGDVNQWIRSILDQWPTESEHRRTAEILLAHTAARARGERFAGDIETTHQQIHHKLLTCMGIDPMTEPWKGLIDLAIKDEDPTRVMILCEQKVVTRHPLGNPMLNRLGLEYANPKLIACSLHNYRIGGQELDAVDGAFTERYCNRCPDKRSRPADWSFRDERRKRREQRESEQ